MGRVENNQLDAATAQRLRELEAENWQLTARVLRLEMLHEVLNVVNAGDTLADTVRGLLQVLIGTFGARSGVAFWFDDANTTWRIASNRGVAATFADELLQRLNLYAQTNHAEDLAGWAEQTLPVFAWLSCRGGASLPAPLGALALGAKLTGEPFSDEERALVTTALLEAARAIENSKLLEISRIKDRFLLHIAHNLTNPLFGIEGSVGFLLSGQYGKLTPAQHEWMVTIQYSVQQLRMLVRNLSDLARINFGRLELQRQPVRMSEVVRSTLATVQAQAQARDIALVVDVPDHLPPIDADFNCLCQIVANLLSNAVKYSLPNGEVKVVARKDHAELVTSVSDRGMGIKKADQERLFQEFFRADAVRARQIEGTGLGLAITRRLVELHGGRIWVESTFRKGSTFSFSLPLHNTE